MAHGKTDLRVLVECGGVEENDSRPPDYTYRPLSLGGTNWAPTRPNVAVVGDEVAPQGRKGLMHSKDEKCGM